MASGLSSPTGVAGILLLVIGIIMAVVGIIFLIAGQTSQWWTWLLLIGGVVLGIIGGILIATALLYTPIESRIVYTNAAPVPVVMHQQPQYVVSAPQQVMMQQPQVVYSHSPSPPTVVSQPQVQTRSYQVSQEHFDPDPQVRQTTSTVVSPPTPRRTTVIGPYGPQGENIQISGTYTPPAVATQTVTTTAYDVANHPVQSVPVGTPQQQYIAQPVTTVRQPIPVAQPAQQFISPAPVMVSQLPAGTAYQIQRVPSPRQPMMIASA